MWKPASQTVFGEGPQDARVLVVGEQPSDAEDLSGRPFIGPAGKLFELRQRDSESPAKAYGNFTDDLSLLLDA